MISIPAPFLRDTDWDYDLIEDASVRSEPHNAQTIARGFRSALRVPVRLDGRPVAGLAFLSRSPSAYTSDDTQMARRIADRFALSLSHERLFYRLNVFPIHLPPLRGAARRCAAAQRRRFCRSMDGAWDGRGRAFRSTRASCCWSITVRMKRHELE